MKVVPPKRVSHSYEQTIDAAPDVVFPLYCPVREAEWIEGWDPVAVYSQSGRIEHDCVFVTSEGERESIWTVTRHDPQALRVEMVKVTPGVTVCRLEIQLAAHGKSQTKADVTYTHTSLGPAGDEFVEAFTETYYEEFMELWEDSMNHFLRTGERIEA